MAALVLKKHPITRAAHYLFLLPFLPALRPLMVNFQPSHMIIYVCGVLLVIFLIIYGNQQPLLRSGREGLSIYLHYRQNAEYHPFAGMVGYRRVGRRRITIYSEDHRPIVLTMNISDVDTLIELLKEEQVHEK